MRGKGFALPPQYYFSTLFFFGLFFEKSPPLEVLERLQDYSVCGTIDCPRSELVALISNLVRRLYNLFGRRRLFNGTILISATRLQRSHNSNSEDETERYGILLRF